MRDYLKQLVAFRRTMKKPEGFNYCCIEDYVLDRGVEALASEPLTEDEATILWRAAGGSRFKQKECFYNAQRLCLHDLTGELQYQEGYAIGSAGFPVHHGWVTINGKVIDLTWRTAKPMRGKGRLRNRIIGVIPEGWKYIGVPFPTEEIRRRWLEMQAAVSFIGDWQAGFPCLQQSRRQSTKDESQWRSNEKSD